MNFQELESQYKNTEFVSLFKELINLLHPEVYMELGIRKGYTFNQIAPLVKRAIGIDIEIRDSIIKLPNVELLQMTTDEAVKIWETPIDFLFIDACHEKNQVLKDFENFSKFVKEGTGIIAMHDTHPICKELLVEDRCYNAWEAALYIKDHMRNEFEFFTIPGPFAGLTLLRKAKKHLSWD